MTLLRLFRPALLVLALLPAGAMAQDPDERDLQALRFYINENNEQAIRSELRRLQVQFPEWSPPDDLSNLNRDVPPGLVDGIYQLIAREDFAGARDRIEDATRTYPNWTPSADLLQTLSLAEAQREFTAAVDAGNSQAAIRIARATPALLVCERVNNAWLLAEQYQAVGQTDTARGIYRGVADSCTTPDVLVATLEKSASVSNAAQLQEMAALMRNTAPGVAAQINAVETRLLAGLGAAPAPGAAPAEAPAAAGVPVTDATRPEARPATLGQPRPAPAQAPASRTMAAPAPAGAARAAPSGGGGAGYNAVLAAAQAGDWRRCLSLATGAKQPEIVSQRGWCNFNIDRPMQALKDFRAAASSTRDGNLQRDSLYGMALTMLRMNMVDQAASVAAQTHFTPEQRLEIETEILDKRGVAAYERGDYRRAIAYFDEVERLTGRMRRDLAMLKGYAYLNSGQRDRARALFQMLHDQMATAESRRALAAAIQ
jgi:tetratricopeptide (TPR) repeat protein